MHHFLARPFAPLKKKSAREKKGAWMPVFECCCAAAEIRKFVTCMVTTLRPTLLLLLASLSSNMTENWALKIFLPIKTFLITETFVRYFS